MNEKISLKSFIEEVKTELKESINNDDPFFIMGDVELEVSFSLDAEAKAGAKLVVFDIGGSTKATQTHKVKLTLSPFVESESVEEAVPKNKRIYFSLRRPERKVTANSSPKAGGEIPLGTVGSAQLGRGARRRPICSTPKSNRTFIAHKSNRTFIAHKSKNKI